MLFKTPLSIHLKVGNFDTSWLTYYPWMENYLRKTENLNLS